jgi:hypothetical protein
MPEKRRLRLQGALVTLWLGSTAALSGCGGLEGVELQGGVFDVLGISSNALAAKGKEPQIPQRAGIVLPPNHDRLPQPGSGAPPDATAMLPDDVDERKLRQAGDLEKQHKEFCEKALREARVRGDDRIIQGPKGQCNQSILNTFGYNTNNLNQPINTK